MPKIIVQFGGEEWSVDLREGVNVAGRSPQAAIAIRDASMSREHCEIVLEGSTATVVDRGSMNGTLVNGTKMDRKVLVPGDRIQIGKASMYFESKKSGGAPAAAPAADEPVVGLDDFSVWRRESGGLMKVVIGLVVLGLLGGGAVFLFKSLGRDATVAADPSNLLGTSGRFDPGPDNSIVGWVMKQGQASRLQSIEGSAKQGKFCLQLEKSGAAHDLVAEVLYQEVFPVPSTAPLEVSTWVRSESSNVMPALKVSWLAARKGPVIFEDASEPSPASSDWTQVSHTFTPPSMATHVQLSLIAAGRSGRVLFDDVRARFGNARAGSGGLKSARLGPYSVLATQAGVLNIEKETNRVLSNVQLFLASDKEGTMHQVAATAGRTEQDDAARKLTSSGKLQSPVDLRPVEYDIEARGGKEGLLLGYRLRGDALKQVERLGLALLIPGADLKGDYTNPVQRLWFRGGLAGDYILEFTDGLMRVTADWVPEARRIVLAIPVPKGASEVVFSFSLKSGAGGATDPMAEVDQAIAQGRMSDALAVLKELVATTREEKKSESLKTKLKVLEEKEAEEWKSVQALSFQADLVGLKPKFEEAILKLDEYEKRWPGGRRVEAGKAERAKLTAGHAAAAEDRETLRAHRLVDRAEEHLKEGRKLLARELCESVRRHYASTSAAARAADVLKSLGSE